MDAEKVKEKMANMGDAEKAKYAAEFSEQGFWDKVVSIAKLAGFKVISYALAVYYVLASGKVKAGAKVVLIGALGYFICPIDMIADFIPFIGYLDDTLILLGALELVSYLVTDDIVEQVYLKLREWFDVRNKKAVAKLLGKG
jgi:uncharacterized membrane protein YkvA (DUF1232 family)